MFEEFRTNVLAMQNNIEINNTSFEVHDIKNFKSILLTFMLIEISYMVLYYVNIILAEVVGVVGFLVLIVGISKISLKYTQLSSGIRISILLLIIEIFYLVYSVLPLIFITNSTTGAVDQQMIDSIKKDLSIHILVITIFVVLPGMLTLFVSIYISKWLKQSFGKFPFNNGFIMYGLLQFINSIILAMGSYMLLQSIIKGEFTNSTTTFAPTSTIGITIMLIFLAGIIKMVAIIIVIIASYQVYNHVNSIINGKFNINNQYGNFNAGWNPSQQQITYASNENNNYSASLMYQNNTDLPFGNKNMQNITNKIMFCSKCGTNIQNGQPYCNKCGNKIT